MPPLDALKHLAGGGRRVQKPQTPPRGMLRESQNDKTPLGGGPPLPHKHRQTPRRAKNIKQKPPPASVSLSAPDPRRALPAVKIAPKGSPVTAVQIAPAPPNAKAAG